MGGVIGVVGFGGVRRSLSGVSGVVVGTGEVGIRVVVLVAIGAVCWVVQPLVEVSGRLA